MMDFVDLGLDIRGGTSDTVARQTVFLLYLLLEQPLRSLGIVGHVAVKASFYNGMAAQRPAGLVMACLAKRRTMVIHYQELDIRIFVRIVAGRALQ